MKFDRNEIPLIAGCDANANNIKDWNAQKLVNFKSMYFC